MRKKEEEEETLKHEKPPPFWPGPQKSEKKSGKSSNEFILRLLLGLFRLFLGSAESVSNPLGRHF